PSPWTRLLHLLAGVAVAAVAGQAATDAPERLDDKRCRGCLPGSELLDALSHHSARIAPLQSLCHDGNSPLQSLSAAVQYIALSPDYEISRVIRGGWQLSDSHSATTSDDPVSDMIAFADAGIRTFDCADIYTGVEELIGRFRQRYR